MDTVQKAPAGQPVSDPWQHARSHAAKASELLAAAPECHCGDPENCPYEVPQASIAAIAHAHATTGLLYAAIGNAGVIDVFDIEPLKLIQSVPTERGANTIAFDATRNRVYAFLPQTHRAAVFVDRP